MPSDQTSGCPICLPDDPAAAYERAREMETIAELIEESHFSVTVRACRTCAQRFVWVFTETINWVHGNDPQLCTMLPITEDESNQLIAQGQQVETLLVETLGACRRHLLMHFPSSGPQTICYTNEGTIIGPHD